MTAFGTAEVSCAACHKPCGAGTYWDTDRKTCAPCPAGTYWPGAKGFETNQCIPCTSGKSSYKVGAKTCDDYCTYTTKGGVPKNKK